MDRDNISLNPTDDVFLHRIDLTNFLLCHNLSLSDTIASPDHMASVDPGIAEVHKSLRDVDIQQIRNGILPNGVITPRAGGRIYNPAATGTKTNDIELKFEEVRRTLCPDAASRLCCLYVAENSKFGEEHIKKMFNSDENIYIVEVRISSALRVTKADTTWYDSYYTDPKQEYIENYWNSIPYDENNPTWEYLVEGAITIHNQKDLDYIKKHGATP